MGPTGHCPLEGHSGDNDRCPKEAACDGATSQGTVGIANHLLKLQEAGRAHSGAPWCHKNKDKTLLDVTPPASRTVREETSVDPNSISAKCAVGCYRSRRKLCRGVAHPAMRVRPADAEHLLRPRSRHQRNQDPPQAFWRLSGSAVPASHHMQPLKLSSGAGFLSDDDQRAPGTTRAGGESGLGP